MAHLFGDSFDHYADADKATKWSTYIPGTNGSITISATGGARGTRGLYLVTTSSGVCDSGSLFYAPTPAPSGPICIFGIRVKPITAATNYNTGVDPDGSTTCCLFACRTLTTALWWARLLPNGKIAVYRGTNLLCTTSVALVQNVFTYVEIGVYIHATQGAVTICLNGSIDTQVLNLNTTSTGGVAWSVIQVGPIASTGGAVEVGMDDFYLLDGSQGYDDYFWGDTQVLAQRASGTTTAEWTRSAGSSQFGTIDEDQANGDTDYNSTLTPNALDLVNYPAVTAGAIIRSLQLVGQVKRVSASATDVRWGMLSAGVQYYGDTFTITNSYVMRKQIFPRLPGNGSLWVPDTLVQAAFGYQYLTGVAARVSQLVQEVFIRSRDPLDPVLLKADTADLDDDGTPFRAYVRSKAFCPSGQLKVLSQLQDPLLVAKSMAGTSVQLTVTRDFGIKEQTSVVDLSPSASESRVVKKYDGAATADATVMDYTLGDANDVASAWSLERLHVPIMPEGNT